MCYSKYTFYSLFFILIGTLVFINSCDSPTEPFKEPSQPQLDIPAYGLAPLPVLLEKDKFNPKHSDGQDLPAFNLLKEYAEAHPDNP